MLPDSWFFATRDYHGFLPQGLLVCRTFSLVYCLYFHLHIEMYFCICMLFCSRLSYDFVGSHINFSCTVLIHWNSFAFTMSSLITPTHLAILFCLASPAIESNRWSNCIKIHFEIQDICLNKFSLSFDYFPPIFLLISLS